MGDSSNGHERRANDLNHGFTRAETMLARLLLQQVPAGILLEACSLLDLEINEIWTECAKDLLPRVDSDLAAYALRVVRADKVDQVEKFARNRGTFEIFCSSCVLGACLYYYPTIIGSPQLPTRRAHEILGDLPPPRDILRFSAPLLTG